MLDQFTDYQTELLLGYWDEIPGDKVSGNHLSLGIKFPWDQVSGNLYSGNHLSVGLNVRGTNCPGIFSPGTICPGDQVSVG